MRFFMKPRGECAYEIADVWLFSQYLCVFLWELCSFIAMDELRMDRKLSTSFLASLLPNGRNAFISRWIANVCQIHVQPKVSDFNGSNSSFFHPLRSFWMPIALLYSLLNHFQLLSFWKWNSSRKRAIKRFLTCELKNSTLFKLFRRKKNWVCLFPFCSDAREERCPHAQHNRIDFFPQLYFVRMFFSEHKIRDEQKNIPTDLNGKYFEIFIFLIRHFSHHRQVFHSPNTPLYDAHDWIQKTSRCLRRRRKANWKITLKWLR